MRQIHNELYSELLTDNVTLKQNKHHLRIPTHKRFEIEPDIPENEEIKPTRDVFTNETILDYNEFYLSIQTDKTQIIDQRIRQICNKHGYDFGTMIIFTEPPHFNPDLKNTLLIKLVDINKTLV